MRELAAATEQGAGSEQSSKVQQVDRQPSAINWKAIWKPLSLIIGLIMHLLFRKEEQAKAQAALHMPEP